MDKNVNLLSFSLSWTRFSIEDCDDAKKLVKSRNQHVEAFLQSTDEAYLACNVSIVKNVYKWFQKYETI